MLNQGDTLEILDSTNETWYQVSYTDSDGERYTGYVSRDLVTIGTTAGTLRSTPPVSPAPRP